MKDGIELDLKEVFKLLKKRLWIIIVCALVAGAAVYVYVVNFVPKTYQAEVSMYINNKYRDAESDGLTSANLTAAQKLVDAYVELIKRDRVLDEVVNKIYQENTWKRIDDNGQVYTDQTFYELLKHQSSGGGLTAAQVRGMLSARPVNDTAIFEVTVTSKNPYVSYAVAWGIAEVAPKEIPEIVSGSYTTVVDMPKMPTRAVANRAMLKATLGAVFGSLAAALFFVLSNLLDPHVRTEEELEHIGDISVLGVIPDFTQPIKEPKKKVRR